MTDEMRSPADCRIDRQEGFRRAYHIRDLVQNYLTRDDLFRSALICRVKG